MKHPNYLQKLIWHFKHQIKYKAEWEAQCKICIEKFVREKRLWLIRLIDFLIKGVK